jgi:hypothetical protein
MEVSLFISNSDIMKRGVLYIILTIVFYFALEGAGRLALNYVVNNIPDNTSHLSKVNKSLSVDNVDFIVVGMSTAEHNYNIKIFEDSLDMQGYDCGSDGRNIYYDYMVVKNAIKHNENLKLVIADLGRNGLTNVTKDRISIVYPFYWKNPVVREVTKELKGKKMDFMMLSSMYQMNSGVQNVWRLYHPLTSGEYKGFTAYPYTDKTIDLTNVNPNTDELIVDESVLLYLNSIINECKSNNVSVVIVSSPTLISDRTTTNYIREFAFNHEVEYFDCSQCEEIIADTKLFKDHIHLNKKGAEVFSKLLSNRIKKSNND